MTAVTTHFPVVRVNRVVDEIVLNDSWRDRLEAIAGDRKRVIVWAAAVGAMLLLSLGVARAGAPEPVVAPPATAESAVSTPPVVEMFVHVAGAVAKPGLYRFPPGLRVADAIEAAGGPLPRADVDALNLADLLADGMKIEVPLRGRSLASSPAASPSPALIDLNAADVTALETVPGIGPVTAAAIVRHRDEIGRFESVEQLLDVSGIGPATLEALRPYVTV